MILDSAGRVNCASADWVTYIPIITGYTSGSLKCGCRMFRMLETQLCISFGKLCFFKTRPFTNETKSMHIEMRI